MLVNILWIATLFSTGVQSVLKFPCENNEKYLSIGICLINGFYYGDDLTNLSEDSFPYEANLEFRFTFLSVFGVELFQLLPSDAKHLTFRDGFLREVNFKSSSIETLRVLNTDLVALDAVSEPNYSLKQLSVRSPVYSKWSESLSNLIALEVIDVAYCNFSYLSLDWFEGHRNLRVLDVSKNRLHTIHSRPGLTMSSLEELYLWGNRLEFVWRFPDAFPRVGFVSLSENLWVCTWVTMARDAIQRQGILLMDSDYSCSDGWIKNGGLCCRMHDDLKLVVDGKGNNGKDVDVSSDVLTSPPPAAVLVDYIMGDANDTVIGVSMSNTAVYVDKPLSE